MKLYLSSLGELLQTVGVSASILCSGLKEQSMFVSALHVWVNLPTLVKPHRSVRTGMVEVDICVKLYFVCGATWP